MSRATRDAERQFLASCSQYGGAPLVPVAGVNRNEIPGNILKAFRMDVLIGFGTATTIHNSQTDEYFFLLLHSHEKAADEFVRCSSLSGSAVISSGQATIIANRPQEVWAATVFTTLTGTKWIKQFAGQSQICVAAPFLSSVETWRRLEGRKGVVEPGSGILPTREQENKSRLFPGGVPDDADVVDLVVRLDAAKGTGEKQLDTARNFTGESIGNDKQARLLLANIRMMKKRGKLNL